MHVLQWLAVKIETEDIEEDADVFAEEASSIVETFLDSELNPGSSWFDWFVVGGGRYNPNQDNYNTSYDMVISLAEHGLPAIEEKVQWAIDARMREFADYNKDISFDSIKDKLNNYSGVMDYSFELYPLNKAIDMLQGNWDFNSYFFDVEHESTNPKHMLDKLASGDVNWYLVPVDFHF